MNGYVIVVTSLTLFWWSEVTWVTSKKVIPTEVKIGLLMPPEGQQYSSTIQRAVDVMNVSVTSEDGTNVTLTQRLMTLTDTFTLSLDVCSLLSDGAAVILTLSPCDVISLLGQLPVLYHVPVINLDGTSCDVTTDPDTSLEGTDVLASAIDVMVKENWDDVQIFYETEYEAHTVWLVYQLSQAGRQSSIFTFTMGNTSSMVRLKETFQLRRYFLVLASSQGTAWILTKARLSDLDLLGPEYLWLLVDAGQQLQRERLLNRLIEGDNVVIMAHDRTETEALEDKLNTTLPWLADGVRSVISDNQWTDDLHTCDTRGVDYSLTKDKLLQALQTSKPVVPERRVNILTLTGHPHQRVGWALIGSWKPTSGYSLDSFLYPELHRGFNNRTFIITTTHYPPFTIRRTNGTFEGICFDILNELQRVMNFSYKVIEPHDGQWGVELANGSFSGMFGLLEQKKVDFGVGVFGVTAQRQKVVDYTTPFMADPSIVLMRKPNLASSQVFICLGPFHYSVWLLVALSVLVVGAVLWFMVWYHPLHDSTKKQDINTVGIYDPRINIWQVFGAIMQQGMVYIPESHSARLLLTSWWFYVIVVVGTYNGNLIAFLTAPKVYTPINSLQELSESGMKFGFLRSSAIHGVFESVKGGMYGKLWQSIKNNQEEYLVDNNIDGMQKALHDRNYAMLLEKSFYDTLANKDAYFRNKSCEFARAKASFMTTFYAFPFQKNSPYTKLFSKRLLRILEAGLVQRWQRQWYAVVHRCTGLERTTEQTNISLAEAQGAFYILGIGILVATVFLFSEKVLSKRLRSKHGTANADVSISTSTGTGSNGHVRNGAVYHVGSLPPVVPMITTVTSLPLQERTNHRTREINNVYAKATFSPYAKWKQRKVRKSHSFPLLFKSCCRKAKITTPRDEGPAWELPTQNGGISSDTELQAVSTLFSYGPPTAWYDQFGRTSRTALANGTLGRRCHSDTEPYTNGHVVKDAETGESHAKNKGE